MHRKSELCHPTLTLLVAARPGTPNRGRYARDRFPLPRGNQCGVGPMVWRRFCFWRLRLSIVRGEAVLHFLSSEPPHGRSFLHSHATRQRLTGADSRGSPPAQRDLTQLEQQKHCSGDGCSRPCLLYTSDAADD